MGGNNLIKIVGIRFKKPGKIYYFNPKNFKLNKNDNVIVETASGEEFGEVVIEPKDVKEEKILSPLKDVIRIANDRDRKHYEDNKRKEKEAYEICSDKIKKHKLSMNLLDVEYKFDNTKILFYFTADGRIDFRELVKELAAIFKKRIELRQIGVRDEVRRIGGNGVCGRELCCCSFLASFETVSIKMAKEQNVSLNPSKISGNCGRLMCCLKYEQEVYEEKLKKLPKIGAIVKTADGEGEVCGIETLSENIKVKFIDGEDIFYKKYNIKDVEIIKNVEKNEPIDDLDSDELKELEELENLDKIEQNEEDDI